MFFVFTAPSTFAFSSLSARRKEKEGERKLMKENGKI